ncbi:hypothetical protein DVH05_017906, partial [Phytophthora capsici]
MTSPHYYYLKPGVLDTPGFAYGVGYPSEEAEVEVHLVTSGRWHDYDDNSTTLPLSAARPREVSELEAKSGPGTYVGSCVCVAHRWDGAAERWTYGVITGFRWRVNPRQCVLHVSSMTGNFEFPYDEELLQDLAAET